MYILNIILKHYSSSGIYCIMSYFETVLFKQETVLFKQSSTISATSQAEDRQVRITILRVRASFNLAIESRRKQFDK
ncbi:hypothetical protein T08_3554 [Trichinella sp. T8]|nr:hypothetical protein T08_3554 [Trichinella sp. T8]